MKNNFRNCINCGAPFETNHNTCPYCGTSYIDLCGIKLDGQTPFILQFETEINGQKAVISGKFVADKQVAIEAAQDSDVAVSSQVTMKLELHSLFNDGSLFKINIE